MNFAPYQDSDPGTTRALSPPPKSPPPTSRSPPPARYVRSPRLQPQRLPSPSSFADPQSGYANLDSELGSAPAPRQVRQWGNTSTAEAAHGLDMFTTSLPLRLDWEACLAYLLLPPAGPALLLVFEHKSDYVRFHAWQSALLASVLFVLHLLLSWSGVLSWILFILDIVAFAFLAWRAWRDASTLDRCEIPVLGRWASNFVDEE